MKRNLILGIALIGAVALSSCSTSTKVAGNAAMDDDVYYTTAKAGDRVEYINDPEYLASQQEYNDDYYYYGDYASRINRFNYFSPFGYYDMPYYGYSPYYGSMYGMGMGMGIGYGWGGYGYSPYFDMGWGFGGLGYGYSGMYGYGLGYGYGGGWGYGIGYGGLGGWGYGGGVNLNARSRPNYANGNNPAVTRTIRSNMPTTTPALRGTNGQGRSVNTNTVNGTQQNGTRATRQVREVAPRPQQQPIIQRAPQPQSIGGGNFGGGGGGGNSGGGGGGGGGGRPARP